MPTLMNPLFFLPPFAQVNGNLKYLEGHGPESEIEGSGELHMSIEEAEAYAKEIEEQQMELMAKKKAASGK